MNTSNSMGNLSLRSESEIKESEAMAHYLDGRVNDIEKSFTGLTNEFIGYARRTAKLRNNGDKIAEILKVYILKQQYNSSMNDGISDFSHTLSVVEDLRDVELDRMKVYVIKPMLDYNGTLKEIRAEIKRDMAARKKELASYKKLDKSHTSGTVDQAKARATSQMAVLEATTQTERLMKTVSQFEQKKLEHVQSVLKSFIHIEMLWHTRALEKYTEAYNALNTIDCQGDLHEFLEDLKNFRSQDHLRRSNSNLNSMSRRSQSLTNLRSTNASSQGDLSGRNELRTSVTFEDQHQRSRSFQNQPMREAPVPVGRTTVGKGASQTELNKAKPPAGAAHRPGVHQASSDESEYTDDDEYTEDGTTSPSRTASARSTNRSGNPPAANRRGH